MKKLILILCILFTFDRVSYCPDFKTLYIEKQMPVDPFLKLWEAVCSVESSNDPKAYNRAEDAVGISQIRPIRLRDFNRLSGKQYKLIEMYDPLKSKEVFYYFAAKYHTSDIKMIACRWNGSGKQTEEYWKKIKSKIN